MFGLMGNQVLSGRWQWDEELKLKDHPEAGEETKIHFTKALWDFTSNLFKKICCSDIKTNDPITTQFCTCHDSSAVMTCAKLWYDLVIIVKVRVKFIFTKFQMWVHKTLCIMGPLSKWRIHKMNMSSLNIIHQLTEVKSLFSISVLMAWSNTIVSPASLQWRHFSLALSCRECVLVYVTKLPLKWISTNSICISYLLAYTQSKKRCSLEININE